MQDRRRAPRRRSYLGARIAFNGRNSVADCLVRDLSARGAGVAMSDTVMLPDVVELEVGCRDLSARARVAWRTPERLGLAFIDAAGADLAAGDVISLAATRRIRELEAENALLRRRIADLDGVG